jgi:hypothetical protein
VLILAIASDVGLVQAHVWSALAQPSQLASLTVGAAPFVAGSTLNLAEVPVDNTGIGSMGDQTAIVGPRADGTGLNLLWLGPDGRAVSHAGTSNPLVSGSNQVSIAAVQFGNAVVGAGATLFVAWIEDVPPPGGGQPYQQIKGAKVSCAPADGG